MCRIDHIKGDSRSQSSEGELFLKTAAKYQLARLKKCSHLQNLFSRASSLPKVFFSAIHSTTTTTKKIFPLQTKQSFRTGSYFGG